IAKGVHSEISSAQAASGVRESVGVVREALREYWMRSGIVTNREDAATAYGIKDEIAAKMLALCGGSRASFEDVQKSIPSNAILLDFVLFWPQESTGVDQPRPSRYAAYLTFPLAKDSSNSVVERVDLGEAAPIDAAVDLICKRMSSGVGFESGVARTDLQRLGDLVYAPLA